MGGAGRLLRMGASGGPTNMAVDEALAGLSPDRATLRFYTWDAPALSIGYFQRIAEIDLAACHQLGVTLVRRPTGGRAVLHRLDLSYCLVLPLRSPWTAVSIAESYHRINACMQRGFEILGMAASIGPGQVWTSSRRSSPFCFSTIADQEVLVGGKKVIGSAQRRFPGALLQQGSILFDFDPAGHLALLRAAERARAVESFRVIGSLREVLGRLPDRLAVEAALLKGFASEMGMEFAEELLDSEEVELAGRLAESRYGSDRWTFRR